MITDKIAIALGIVCALLVIGISAIGWLLNSTYKQLAAEEVKVKECIVSLEELNRAIAKANASIKQLEIESKNYGISKQKLQNELNKIYEGFNGATSCKGIITNVDKSFQLMMNRLYDLETQAITEGL